ncbi:hypothetical protein DFH28DRAFT_1040857 [Melampsora americana]|nr:hypothetical protein DFH28DRAFT_1040857 [Melampsora americana]
MTHNNSPSSSTHSKLNQTTRTHSTTLPLHNLTPSRYNHLELIETYSNLRRVSIPHNNLPPNLPDQPTMAQNLVPRLEMSTKHDRAPSLTRASKPTLDNSLIFGDEYVPLSSFGSARAINNITERRGIPSALPACLPATSPSYSANSLSSTRRAKPSRQFPIARPSIEPEINIKRFHLPTSSNHSCGSPNSLSSGSMSLPSSHGSVFVPLRTSFPQSQIIPPWPKRFRSSSIGNFGHVSVCSLPESFKTNDTNGFVHRPTAIVLSEEYYHSQIQTKQTLKKSSSLSRVRRLSGCFLTLLKGGEEVKK